jgi:HK97 family phage prohead protease
MLHQHYRLALIGGFPPEFLEENDKGLFVEGHINLEVQAGKELYSLAKQGVLKDMSIGFTTKKSDTDEETGIRTLKEIKLWEISLVDEPANTQAQIVDVKADKKYSCECIECGYKIKTDKHCKDLKCSKCGGQMRRVGRPGPGQKDDDYDLETTIEDIYNGNVKTISDFLKHEKGLSNEEVKAVIVALKKLSKAQGKEYDSQKANLQVDNFLVNSLLNEIIKVQEKI